VLSFAASCFTVGSAAPVSADLELLLRAVEWSDIVTRPGRYSSAQRSVTRSGRPGRCRRAWSFASVQSDGMLSFATLCYTVRSVSKGLELSLRTVGLPGIACNVLLLGQIGRAGVGRL